MVDATFLKTLSAFGGLTDAERATVRDLLEERAYAVGAPIVNEGEPGREFFAIVSGTAEVLKRAPDGHASLIAEIGAGGCFGEMALIGIMPRSASVRAKTDVRVLVLPYAKITRLSQDHLQTFTVLVMNFAREACRRLRAADAVLGEFGLSMPKQTPGGTWAG